MELNVLVVDDSSVMRAMIIKTIRMSGLELGDVYQAANGREGLDAARDVRIGENRASRLCRPEAQGT